MHFNAGRRRFVSLSLSMTSVLVLAFVTGCGGGTGTDTFVPEYRTDAGVIVYYEPMTPVSTRESIIAKYGLKENPITNSPDNIFYFVRPGINLETLSAATENESGITKAGVWGTGGPGLG